MRVSRTGLLLHGRRSLLAGSLLAALSLAATACSGVDPDDVGASDEDEVDLGNDEDGEEQPADSDAEVTLTYSWWGGDDRNRLTNDVADLFEEANPGVGVRRQHTDWSSYWERLAVQSAAADEPDIVSMHPNNLVEYVDQGVLEPLDPYVDDGTLDVDDIPEGILEAGRVDGTLYMVSVGNPFNSIIYDTDALAEAGLEAPGPGYTWDELFQWYEDWAAAIPEGPPWVTLGHRDSEQHFFSFLLSQGVQPFTADGQLGFEREHLADWFDRWAHLQEIGATPPQDVVEEEGTPTIEDSMLVRDRVHSQGVPSNQLQTFDDLTDGTLDILPLPAGPAGPGHVLLPAGLSISANTEHPEIVAQFISFFVNDPDAGVAYRADNGVPGSPVQRDRMIDDGLPAGQERVFRLFDEIAEELPAMEPLPAGTPVLIDALDRFSSQVGFDQMSAEEAADGFFAEVEPEFQ